MKTILVKAGKVVNVIKSNPEFNEQIRSQYDRVEDVEDNFRIFIGADFDGNDYINPPDPSDTPLTPEEKLIEEGNLAIRTGQKAKHLMVGYIKSMGLPKANRKQFRQNVQSIIEAVDIGSIDIAIDEIKALTEDGTVITSSSKAMILKVFEDAGYDIS